MNHKRGMSDMVSNVLLTILVVAVVGVVGFFVFNFLGNNTFNLSDIDLKLGEVEAYYNNEAISSKILNSQESMETVYVSITRGNDESNLTGLKFVFVVDGNSYSCTRRSVPSVLETSVYAFKSTIFSKKIPERVEVIPLALIGKTEKVAKIGYPAKIFNTSKVFSEKINECGGFCCTDDDLPSNPVSP